MTVVIPTGGEHREPERRNPLKRIFLDLEYCYPGMTKTSGRPTGRHRRQIVQIAAILVDTNGQETNRFERLVVPAYTTKLPAFFTELTGITQRDTDRKAVPFARALVELQTFCADVPVWTFDQDYAVLKQNCSYINADVGLREFVRVKPLLKRWGLDPSRYSSGTLHKVAGVELSGRVHNALHDVRSMAHGVHFLESRER